MDRPITLTKERLEKATTPNGGYNAKQLKVLGVGFPPKKGWKSSLIGTQTNLTTFIKFVKASGNTEYLSEIERTLPKLSPPTSMQELFSKPIQKQTVNPEADRKVTPYVAPNAINYAEYACYPTKKKASKALKARVKVILNYGIHNAAKLLSEESNNYDDFVKHICEIEEKSVLPVDVELLRRYLRYARMRILMRNGRAEAVKLPPKPTPEEQEMMHRLGLENKLTKSMEKRMRVARRYEKASKVGSYKYRDIFSANGIDKQQYLYVIRPENSNKVKIGISKNPAKRLNALQTANADKLYISLVLKTNDLAINEESRMHRYFKERRLNGEWFRDIDDDEIMHAVGNRAESL